MTLEEQIQQYDDEQFVAENRAEEGARLKNEWAIATAAMDNSLFALCKDDVQLVSPVATNIRTHENEFYLSSTVLSTIIREELNPKCTKTVGSNNTQPTDHQLPAIPKINTNTKKKQ